MKTLHIIALVLVIVGGINWGLVGLFNFDLVAALFGRGTGFSRFIYVLVGLSAVLIAFTEYAVHREALGEHPHRPAVRHQH